MWKAAHTVGDGVHSFPRLGPLDNVRPLRKPPVPASTLWHGWCHCQVLRPLPGG